MRPLFRSPAILALSAALAVCATSTTADADALPVPEVCADVPLGHPSGRVRYFCDCGEGADADCVRGNDASRGGVDAPRRSYEAARRTFEALQPGDTVAFCRGGSFLQSRESRWVNARCQNEKRCVVRDYVPTWASGDEAAPIIRTPAGGRAFSLEDKGRSSHEEGYTFMNLDLRSRGGERGFFVYNDIDDVDICNVDIDGFKIGVHVAGSSKKRKPGSDGQNDRIVLRHSRIRNSPGQGWLGSCNDCAIEHSYFENNGFEKPKFNHNIYLSDSNKGVAKGMRIVGNELYRSAVLNGKCEGVSLVVHGKKDGLLIEGNLVREDIGGVGRGCWGISVDTGYRSPEAFRNVVIRNNRIINLGPISIGMNACSSCLIENNVIVQGQALNGRHIAVPDKKADPDDLPLNEVTIRNNSIWVGPESGGIGIQLAHAGRGHRIVSNAIFYAGRSRWACIDAPLSTSAYDAIDYNVCDAPGISDLQWTMTGRGLVDWQAESSHDTHSRRMDPGFRSVTPPYDLSPADAGSGMVGAGDPLESAPLDLHGRKRGKKPDAGAIQRGSDSAVN